MMGICAATEIWAHGLAAVWLLALGIWVGFGIGRFRGRGHGQ